LLLLLGLLKKYKNQGLNELIYTITGKYAGFAIGFILFLITFAGMIVNMRSYTDIINTMYYQKTPVPVLMLILLIVCFYVSNRGLDTIGKTSWLVVPYIEIFSILLIVFVWQEADVMHVFPLMGPGLMPLLGQSVSHTSMFGEIILLAAFYPYVRSHKAFQIGSLAGLGIAIFHVSLYSAVYVFVFDYPAVRDLVYPFHQLARAAAIGQIITNVEAIFFGFWIMSTVIHFAITLYLIVLLFAQTVHMEKFEPLLLPFTGLIFMLALLPDNVFFANSLRELLLQSSSYLLLVLPLLLWGLDRWKGRIKHAGA
jgi:spore germination protein KB